MQSKGRPAEVVAGSDRARYVFAAAGSAAVLPAVEKIVVGWFSTISCGFLIFSAGLVMPTTIYGERRQTRIDEKHETQNMRLKQETPITFHSAEARPRGPGEIPIDDDDKSAVWVRVTKSSVSEGLWGQMRQIIMDHLKRTRIAQSIKSFANTAWAFSTGHCRLVTPSFFVYCRLMDGPGHWNG